MPALTRLGDKSSGHDSCAPMPLIEASGNVFIDGKGAGRLGDQYAAHGCIVHGSHQDTIAAGSPTVTINGRPAARVGDDITLAGMVQEGSVSVFAG